MARFVLRVWLPDRPGALGRVASAIGSVGASLVAIDILEQDAGWAIDEFVVDAVDSPNAMEKLTAALTFVEGVNVETIRSSPSAVIDARVDALESAAELVEEEKAPGLMRVLVERTRHDLAADWVALVSAGPDAEVVAGAGEHPDPAWLAAFLGGASASPIAVGLPAGGFAGPDDVAWTALEASGLALVLGRDGQPFRARERMQIAVLCRIADRRLQELPA